MNVKTINKITSIILLNGFVREYESRCVQRKLLLEALAGELPEETIRFSSKVVHIELSGCYKKVHLSDGTILKTKVNNYLSSVNHVRPGLATEL